MRARQAGDLLQGSICWTHLPNSVNVLKARLYLIWACSASYRQLGRMLRVPEHSCPRIPATILPSHWSIVASAARSAFLLVALPPSRGSHNRTRMWKEKFCSGTRGLVVTSLNMKIGVYRTPARTRQSTAAHRSHSHSLPTIHSLSRSDYCYLYSDSRTSLIS